MTAETLPPVVTEKLSQLCRDMEPVLKEHGFIGFIGIMMHRDGWAGSQVLVATNAEKYVGACLRGTADDFEKQLIREN